MAVAELSRAKLPRFLAPGFQSIRHDFPTAVAGDSLQVNQISLTGGIPNFPPGPRDESAGFSGATAQLRSGHDGAGILPDRFSVLGDQVTDIFNAEFAPGQARPRVPLTRIDWSGYGATCFSALAVTTHWPSGLKAALLTAPLCRSGRLTGFPDAASHTRAVPSQLAVTTHLPSGLNAAPDTPPLCRIDSPTALPVAASHSRAVPSLLAVTIGYCYCLFAGLNPSRRRSLAARRICSWSMHEAHMGRQLEGVSL